jgi:hypothetical protein
MLELMALPLVLLLLACIVVDKDVRQCITGLSFIYTLDYVVGGMLFTDVSTFYLSMIMSNLLLLLSIRILESTKKQFLCSLVILFLILVNLNEHLSKYQTMFYPYLDHINYWSGEVLSIIVTWNVKWKIYDYKFNYKNPSN